MRGYRSEHTRLVDANVIIRYLIGDGGSLALQARDIIESGEAYTYPEVLAEVVYVLSGYYEASRTDICTAFRALAKHMMLFDLGMLLAAFSLYELTSMDFVDCLLVARGTCLEENVESLDKQVMRLVGQ